MGHVNDFDADAVICGDDLTALLLASGLAHEGLQVIVLQSDDASAESVPGFGTLLCAQRYQRIGDAWGLEAARQYAAALQSQLHALTASPPPYIHDAPALIYARTGDELPLLAHQHDLLRRLQLPVSACSYVQGCPFPAERALLLEGQVTADIPRWMAALRKEIRRLGGRVLRTGITGIEGQQLHTPQGRIAAPVIVHTGGKPPGLHAPTLFALLETRLLLRCTLAGQPPLDSILLPVQRSGLILFPAPEGMDILWDAHRLGSRRQSARLSRLNRILAERLPDWQIGEPHFSQQELPLDGLPLIGTLPGTRRLFATGYDGVLGAMHAAQVLTRRILGRPAPEDRCYSPDRKLPERISRRALLHLAGVRAASALRKAPACPHCRCRMRYSSLSRWECPLCGSVFSIMGAPLYGPSLRPAQLSPRQRPDL